MKIILYAVIDLPISFKVTKDINLEDIKIQEEELTEVRWFTMEELEKMVETKELNEDQISCFLKVQKYLNSHENLKK